MGEKVIVRGHVGQPHNPEPLMTVAQHERIVAGLEARNQSLFDAGKYVVMAFEKMGRTNGVVATMQARTNCEDSMVKLKAAIDAFLAQTAEGVK